MNIEETLKEVKREHEKAVRAVEEAHLRCQHLMWDMETDGADGQERMNADKVLQITQNLKCAERVITT